MKLTFIGLHGLGRKIQYTESEARRAATAVSQKRWLARSSRIVRDPEFYGQESRPRHFADYPIVIREQFVLHMSAAAQRPFVSI